MENQEEIQKAFIAYLIQDAAKQGIQLQSEQDLQAYTQKLGKEGLKAVQDGKVNVTFECTPLIAPKTAEIIQKLEAGINIEKKQYVKENYYDFNSDLGEVIENRSY